MPIRPAPGPGYCESARANIKALIGEDLFQKYESLVPLLALLDYRTRNEIDFTYVMQRVSSDDFLYYYDAPFYRRIVQSCLAVMLYGWLWIKTALRPKPKTSSDKRPVFSGTFVHSKRYPAARQAIEETYGLKSIVAVCDALARSELSKKSNLLLSLKGNVGNCRPIFFAGFTVEGKQLKRAAEKWCRVYFDLREGTVPGSAAMDAMLAELNRAYFKRLAKLKKSLSRHRIDAYITVNQYNLRDLLWIHACYDLGIRTIQLEHHVMQFSRINFSEEEKMVRYSFTQEFCFWSTAEMLFHKKVFRYENMMKENQELKFRTVGNVEIAYKQACSLIQKYPTERRITYMTSALEAVELDTEEQQTSVREWHWRIYRALKELKERQQIAVRVRYNPWCEQELLQEEAPILREWGFEISESTPESLMDDFCSSTAILASTSSVLATAMDLGRLTYRFNDPAVLSYIRVDPRLNDIQLEDIPNLVFPQNWAPAPLDPDCFFSAEKMLAPGGESFPG